MENNDFHFNYNYMSQLNPINKNLSPFKEYPVYQSNGIVNRDNFTNIQNTSFLNNSFFGYATPKKDFHQLEQEYLFSPFVSNSKIDIQNNNLFTSNRRNSLNDISPFKPMINSPYINSKIVDKT